MSLILGVGLFVYGMYLPGLMPGLIFCMIGGALIGNYIGSSYA